MFILSNLNDTEFRYVKFLFKFKLDFVRDEDKILISILVKKFMINKKYINYLSVQILECLVY